VSETVQRLWSETLTELARELPRPSFETWIRPAQPMGYYDDTLVLGVSSETARQIVEERFLRLIAERVSRVFQHPVHVKVVAPHVENDDQVTPTVAVPQARAPMREAARPVANLNPRYTFETFVVGNSNRLAHAAALAVSEMPARAYNPLFMYGGVGLGKTHLMHAIGHQTLTRAPHLKVLYVSTETFTNELINAIRDDRTSAFRNRYRSIDVLLIDDIQFLSGKERTQEEFFHTFEALHGASKQIVISSDRPPKEIPTLEERLRSRFEWGLITDMHPPDLETRIAILRKKAQLENLSLPEDVMTYIATRIETNIRELEGALIRLVAYLSVTTETCTVELAREVLRDIIPEPRPKKITLPLIQEVVAKYYGLTRADLIDKKRTRAVSYPRQIAMYLARELTDASLPKIGDEFGGRDHTTVIHAYEKIQADLEADPSLRALVAELTRAIRG
jgi:chromosomal replication initiator protein